MTQGGKMLGKTKVSGSVNKLADLLGGNGPFQLSNSRSLQKEVWVNPLTGKTIH